MGSFNTQCFVTKQVIAPNDKAILLPIIAQNGYNHITFKSGKTAISRWCSTCYSTRFWRPTGHLLTGTYEDYGRFVLDKTRSIFCI